MVLQGFVRRVAGFLVSIAAAGWLSTPAFGGYDVARDFSTTANPSPPWSYGSELGLGGTFMTYTSSIRGAVDQWSFGGLPNVWHNPSTVTVPQATNLTPPGGFGLHPGPSGEYSIARWTAPASGTYSIVGDFTGLDWYYPTSTDVHILQNNNAEVQLFSGNINSYNVPLNFSLNVIVAAGDTIDFAVGFGSGGFFGDATGLAATITPLATPPALRVTPASLTFAARTVGTTSAPQTVTVTNDGPGVVNVDSVTLTGDFAYTTNCPEVIPAGATCTADVTFTPLAPGLRTGSITAVSNASGSPHTLPLSGTGLAAPAPNIHPSTNEVDFAPHAVGYESPMQVVTVTNDGNLALDFGPITVTGDFLLRPITASATRVPCAGNLPIGRSCHIGVTFRPSRADTLTGSLVIMGNAPAASVRLVGLGIDGPPPRALAMPDRVVFDPQPVGTRSGGLAITITNNSPDAASITELSVTGEFSISDTCTTIPSRADCSPLLFFQPTAVGERTGTLTVRTFAETDPYVVSLTGTGTFNPVPELALSATRLGFGNVLIGSAPQMALTLTNIGMVPVALDGIVAIGDYLVSGDCGATIAEGASCTVNVRFFPRMRGQQGGALEIRSNAEGSPHRVQLSGVGCSVPSVARSRARLDPCSP
jgi:hypothetical protein